MAEVVRINSKKGMVVLTERDIAENELSPWLRTNSAGQGGFSFVSLLPFERVAAKLFVAKYPGVQVKIAENVVFHQQTNDVTVFLRVTDEYSNGFYNKHPVKLVFNKAKTYALDSVAYKEGSDPLKTKSAEEEAADDEDLMSDVSDLLSKLQSMTPEEMMEKISPEELNEIKDILGIKDEETTEEMELEEDTEEKSENPEEDSKEVEDEEKEEGEEEEEENKEDIITDESTDAEGKPVIIKVKLLSDDPNALADLINEHFKDVAAEYGPEIVKDIIEDLTEK
ncbi:MAG TPA: hypothetical protein P5136_00280 [Methanofastidiosum sp.]|nr:hypothetical protein [Methanofastidiosum sp.]